MKHRLNRAEVRLTDEDVQYLDGFLKEFDELPDGAWQMACENAIRDGFEKEPELKRFRERDPFDIWLAWTLAPRPWEKS